MRRVKTKIYIECTDSVLYLNHLSLRDNAREEKKKKKTGEKRHIQLSEVKFTHKLYSTHIEKELG